MVGLTSNFATGGSVGGSLSTRYPFPDMTPSFCLNLIPSRKSSRNRDALRCLFTMSKLNPLSCYGSSAWYYTSRSHGHLSSSLLKDLAREGL